MEHLPLQANRLSKGHPKSHDLETPFTPGSPQSKRPCSLSGSSQDVVLRSLVPRETFPGWLCLRPPCARQILEPWGCPARPREALLGTGPPASPHPGSRAPGQTPRCPRPQAREALRRHMAMAFMPLLALNAGLRQLGEATGQRPQSTQRMVCSLRRAPTQQHRPCSQQLKTTANWSAPGGAPGL